LLFSPCSQFQIFTKIRISLEKVSLQKIKWLRGLRIKKNRDDLNVFVVEGEKIAIELIQQIPDRVIFILSNQDLFTKLNLGRFDQSFIGAVADFEKVTSLNSPPKIIVIAQKFEEREIKTNKRIIVIDGIQDPGNLGTIIRTADWFGFDQIVCSENTVELYNQKVIQASMGSIFRVHVFQRNLPAFLKKLNLPIHGALLHGIDIKSISASEMNVLVMGSEGKGISEEVLQLISHPVLIEGSGNAESLNVGIAAGIFLHHWSR
jgi:TrmH family RNA methyltransferase